MVSVEQLKRSYQRIVGRREARRKNQKKEIRLLPADLTGAVYTKCCEEGEKIKDRIALLREELERVGVQISEAKAAAREAYDHQWTEPQWQGDILDGYEVEPAQPNHDWLIKTPEALEIQKNRVQPLLKYRRSLKGELAMRQSELSELRKIAKMAAAGEVELIHHLSRKWQNRLEIGGALEGVKAKIGGQRVAAMVDAMGNPLPAEALDEQGEPDMDMSGHRVE